MFPEDIGAQLLDVCHKLRDKATAFKIFDQFSSFVGSPHGWQIIVIYIQTIQGEVFEMYFGFLSLTDLMLLIPAFLLAMYAQMKVKSTFAKYSKVRSQSGITGAQAAKALLELNQVCDVEIEETEGLLSDHYDPRQKKLRLSGEIYRSKSVAAIGVAAHEVGHAIQHHGGYAPLQLRNGFFPIANLGSKWPTARCPKNPDNPVKGTIKAKDATAILIEIPKRTTIMGTFNHPAANPNVPPRNPIINVTRTATIMSIS